MVDPLRTIDRWASQSNERVSMLLWCVVIALAVFVVLSVLGLAWYTEPVHVAHRAQTSLLPAFGR